MPPLLSEQMCKERAGRVEMKLLPLRTRHAFSCIYSVGSPATCLWIISVKLCLQCDSSCLENPRDGEPGGLPSLGSHRVRHNWSDGQSRTWLSDFTFTFHFHALEKEMATHSSVLAWRTPGTGEPGGLPSLGSHRVRHDWSDLAAAAAVLPFFACCCQLEQEHI